MSHLPSPLVELLPTRGTPSCSRRALLRGGLGLGLALVLPAALQPAPALAAIVVRVSAPRIKRTGDCLADVAVDVTLSDLPAASSYLLSGDILEADTSTEDADYCCTLHPVQVDLQPGQRRLLTLTQQATSVDLGLVRGLGPATHEAFSPNLVELFARIWLRDLATDDVLGAWDSPQRVAVSRALPGWMPSAHLQSNPLLTPRGPAPATTTRDGRPLPMLPCAQ